MTTSTDYSSIVSSGKPVKIIRAELTLAGATNKEIKELTAGLATKEGWTYSNTLDFLGSELRTQEELYKVILENKSVNEARWISDREKVRALINKVAVKLGAEFTEVLASDSLKNQVKALINKSAVPVSEEPGLGLELGESDKPAVEATKSKKAKK